MSRGVNTYQHILRSREISSLDIAREIFGVIPNSIQIAAGLLLIERTFFDKQFEIKTDKEVRCVDFLERNIRQSANAQ